MTKPLKLPLEKTFQKSLLEELRRIPNTHWFKIHDQCTAGIPDIIGCVAGVFFGFELKTRSKVKAIQVWTLKQIEGAGGHSAVVTPLNRKEIVDFVKKAALLGVKDPQKP